VYYGLWIICGLTLRETESLKRMAVNVNWLELGLKGNSNHVSIREKIFLVEVSVFRPVKGRMQIYYGNI